MCKVQIKQQVTLDNKTILITGVAGFIGAYLTRRLLSDFKNVKVIGIDNLNDYYDVHLKERRLSDLLTESNFLFIKGNIADKELIQSIF